jgi:hypothetical protein
MTLAEKYNVKCKEIMLTQTDLIVPNHIDSASEIEEIVFRRSEYLGGMCAVILELAK